jgi:hypothetical protein
MSTVHSLLSSDEAFGHLGSGGSLGFADPRARRSFGYAMNRLDERGQVLVDAVHRSLGYRRRPTAACGTSKLDVVSQKPPAVKEVARGASG